MHSAILKMLAKTPPNGKAFCSMVKTLLVREKHWVRWKAAKCKSFEREAQPVARRGKKRPAPSRMGGGRGSQVPASLPYFTASHCPASSPSLFVCCALLQKRPTTARVWTIKESTRDIGAACVAATRLARPTVNEYLEALREAENPDNCIEDEYNPKHNKVRANQTRCAGVRNAPTAACQPSSCFVAQMYVWKAQRLLTTEHLEVLPTLQHQQLDAVMADLDAKKAGETGAGAGGGAGAGASTDAGAKSETTKAVESKKA